MYNSVPVVTFEGWGAMKALAPATRAAASKTLHPDRKVIFGIPIGTMAIAIVAGLNRFVGLQFRLDNKFSRYRPDLIC